IPMRFGSEYIPLARVLLPRTRRDAPGLGCSASARRYSRNHSCFLLLRVLRCFSSPGSPPGLKAGIPDMVGGVAPFGHPRIDPSVPVPADFRSLTRPSSPLGAYASPVRPFLLEFPGTARAAPGRRGPGKKSPEPAAVPAQHVKEHLTVSGYRRLAGFTFETISSLWWRITDSNR